MGFKVHFNLSHSVTLWSTLRNRQTLEFQWIKRIYFCSFWKNSLRHTHFVSLNQGGTRPVWVARSHTSSFLLAWNCTIQLMLNPQHFIWNDKTRSINHVHASENVTAGLHGYWITHVNSQSSFPLTLENPIKLAGSIAWNLRVSCPPFNLYHYWIKCFAVRNKQFVTKNITSLPVKEGNNLQDCMPHSASREKQQASSCRSLQLDHVHQLNATVFICRLHFHLERSPQAMQI